MKVKEYIVVSSVSMTIMAYSAEEAVETALGDLECVMGFPTVDITEVVEV